MKKSVTLIHFLVLAIGLLMLISCASRLSMYQNAIENNSVNAYKKFLEKYPTGEYSAEIKDSLITSEIRTAFSKRNFYDLGKIIENYPNHPLAQIAKEKYDYLFFINIPHISSLKSKYVEFMEKYPNGIHKNDVTEYFYSQFKNTTNVECFFTIIELMPEFKFKDEIEKSIYEGIKHDSSLKYNLFDFDEVKKYYTLFPEGKYRNELKKISVKFLIDKLEQFTKGEFLVAGSNDLFLWIFDHLSENSISDKMLVLYDNFLFYHLQYMDLFHENTERNNIIDKKTIANYVKVYSNTQNPKLIEHLAFMKFLQDPSISNASNYIDKYDNVELYSRIIGTLFYSENIKEKKFAIKQINETFKNRNLDMNNPKIIAVAEILPKVENLGQFKKYNLYVMGKTKESFRDINEIEEPALSRILQKEMLVKAAALMDYSYMFNQIGLKCETKNKTRFIILIEISDLEESIVKYGSTYSHSSSGEFQFSVLDTERLERQSERFSLTGKSRVEMMEAREQMLEERDDYIRQKLAEWTKREDY